MEPTIREQQLEALLKWCIPRLKKQAYVEYVKATMEQPADEWKEERDYWSKHHASIVHSKAITSSVSTGEET